MIPADAAWFGLSVTLAGGAIGLVWRSASTATRLEERLATLTQQLERVEKMADVIAMIPALAQRVGTLEDAWRSSRSDITELKERVAAHGATMRWTGGDIGE